MECSFSHLVPKECSVISASLDANGNYPLLSLSNGTLFAYSPSMSLWCKVEDVDTFLGSSYADASQEDSLRSIELLSCLSAADRSNQSMNHLENILAAKEILGSSCSLEEYKGWLSSLVRLALERNEQRKLCELLDDLIGPPIP